jgi:hypothetical protein
LRAVNQLAQRSFLRCVPIVGCFAAAIVGSAQQRPDLSGAWQLVSASVKDARTARILVIRMSEGATPGSAPVGFEVQRVSDSGTRVEGHNFGMGGVVGGITPGSSAPSAHTTRAVYWRGDELLMESGQYSGPDQLSGPYSERSEAWRLSDGALHVAIVERGTGRERSIVELVYQRE